MQLKTQFIILFLLIVLTACGLLYVEKQYRIEQYLQTQSKTNKSIYDTIYSKHHNIAQLVYSLLIDTKEIRTVFTRLQEADAQQKKKLRDRLLVLLGKKYDKLTAYNVKQLHFHLRDNTSFLRLHKPGLHGDDLKEVRPAVAYVNAKQKPFHGFEEGKISNGFRFVYPVWDGDNNHAGSVEISFSTLAISREFIQNFHKSAEFFIDKKVVMDKVLPGQRDHYILSPLDSFLMEKKAADWIFEKIGLKRMFRTDAKDSAKIRQMLQNRSVFSFYNSKMGQVTTVIAVKNRLENKTAGFFAISGKGDYIRNKRVNFYFIILSGTLTLASILFFLYRDMQASRKIRKDSTVLNTVFQEVDSGIGLISLEGRFLKVNHKFTRILGYKSRKLLASRCQDFMSDEDRVRFDKALRIAKRANMLSKMNIIFENSSGMRLHYETSLRYLPRYERFIIVLNKIEDREQLQELNEILDAKIKQQGRQIRIQDRILLKQNRLASMGQALQLVKQRWDGLYGRLAGVLESCSGPKTKRSQEDLDQMEAMLSDIYEFFDKEEQQTVFSAKEAVQNRLLKQAAYLDTYNITFEISGEDFLIEGNKGEFLQAMLHLVSNAKDAIVSRKVSQGRILIRFTDHTITVKDNGKGISQDILPVIFRPFTGTKKDTSGLGLYLTRQLLHRMEARIDAKNAAMGAVFTISFPPVDS